MLELVNAIGAAAWSAIAAIASAVVATLSYRTQLGQQRSLIRPRLMVTGMAVERLATVWKFELQVLRNHGPGGANAIQVWAPGWIENGQPRAQGARYPFLAAGEIEAVKLTVHIKKPDNANYRAFQVLVRCHDESGRIHDFEHVVIAFEGGGPASLHSYEHRETSRIAEWVRGKVRGLTRFKVINAWWERGPYRVRGQRAQMMRQDELSLKP